MQTIFTYFATQEVTKMFYKMLYPLNTDKCCKNETILIHDFYYQGDFIKCISCVIHNFYLTFCCSSHVNNYVQKVSSTVDRVF